MFSVNYKFRYQTKKDYKWRVLADLSFDEKKQLYSAISDYLISKGYQSDSTLNLIGEVYTLIREEPKTSLRDAREFALTLNATARTGKFGLGIAICMGDRSSALRDASKALLDYRQEISKNLKWIDKNPRTIEELENIYVLHGGNSISENVISAISTIISSNLKNHQKPLIAYSTIPKEKICKFSARMNKKLVTKELNLGIILSMASEKFSGVGGGHDVAAGAQIPYKEKKFFIDYIDKKIKEFK